MRWRLRSNRHAGPLSEIQREILLLLASHRNPESYVAGASVLNQDGPRFSADIDIFHDREESVALAASADATLLAEHGYGVEWLRREPGIHAAIVRRVGEGTRLEWVRDSDYRFFPAVRDDLFGYRLHIADIATNKALAAAGRREPRDVLDLLYIHARYLPLGAVIWAAVAKDPGFSPESLITEIRRNARYRADDYADLNLTEPVDAAAVSRGLREVPAGHQALDGWPHPHHMAIPRQVHSFMGIATSLRSSRRQRPGGSAAGRYQLAMTPEQSA